jgi:hypothetical protein
VVQLIWFSVVFLVREIKLGGWSVSTHLTIVPFCLLSQIARYSYYNVQNYIFTFYLYGFETWPLTFEEIQAENVYEEDDDEIIWT